jgi:hypothetical protein
MNGDTPLLPLHAFMAWTGTALLFYLSHQNPVCILSSPLYLSHDLLEETKKQINKKRSMAEQ